MKHHFSSLTIILVAFFITACTAISVAPALPTTPAEPSGEVSAGLHGEVIVFAAASLTEAFGELSEQFTTQHPGTQIVYNFGGSQQLAQQLGQGAPADIFASANTRQMEVAIEAGRVVSGTQQEFVRNSLVVIYPADNPAQIATLQDLARTGLKVVLAAPEVPAGAYARDFLEKASASAGFDQNYSEQVLANVVSYEENVRSVLSKIALGEADAGIVYHSDVVGSEGEQVAQIEIPDAFNTVASYPIAPVADSSNPALAQAYIDFILSPEGQAILMDYGFLAVQ